MNQEEFEAKILFGVEENFRRDHEIIPVLVGTLDGEDSIGVIPLGQLMGDVEGKELVGALIANFRAKVELLAFVSEVWMVQAKTTDAKEAMKVAPSQHPDRVEKVMVNFYYGPKVKVWLAEIIRPELENPRLGNWESLDELKVTGRMMQTPAEWN